MIEKSLEQWVIDEIVADFTQVEDFEIIAHVMCTMCGWAEVRVNYNCEDRKWIDAKDWIYRNCRGEHQEHNGHWIFENPAEATWFKMRWL